MCSKWINTRNKVFPSDQKQILMDSNPDFSFAVVIVMFSTILPHAGFFPVSCAFGSFHFNSILFCFSAFHSTSSLRPVAMTSALEAGDAALGPVTVIPESGSLRFSSNIQLSEAINVVPDAVTIAPEPIALVTEPVTLNLGSVIGAPDEVICHPDSVTRALEPVILVLGSVARGQEPVTGLSDVVSAVPEPVTRVRDANMPVYYPIETFRAPMTWKFLSIPHRKFISFNIIICLTFKIQHNEKAF